jgi:putative addiction module component (TIGR02574 family)
MNKTPISEILELSIPERILAVEDIWDSIVSVPKAVSLTEPQRKELDRRLKEYHKNPEAGSPWPKVKARILSDK